MKMATLKRQSEGKAWKLFFLVGFLLVVVEVAAFQSNVFVVPSKQWKCGKRIDNFAAGRCLAYGTNHESSKSSYIRSRLSMAADSGSDPQEGSKRKRFKERIKKILSYPKNIVKKFQGQQEGAAASAETTSGNSTIIEREAKITSGGVNGSAGTTETVNGSVLSLERTVISAPTAVLDRATATTETSGRTATSQTTDLSGKWQLIVSDEFKTAYDNYLKLLGQPSLVRSVALSIIGMTSEETIQANDGRELIIRGRNIRGFWERKLEASAAEDPLILPIVTADQETVHSECWWEDNGRVHHSWLREVNKYGGGSFESKRYLEDGGDTLVCESTFFPTDSSKEKAGVSWRFKRMDKK